MYLEDYVVGSVTQLAPFDAELEEILTFARRFDPQPFHIDEAAAAAGPYGGIIASGWHTCAMVMRGLVETFLSPQTSLGSPGVDELRWFAPVRPGDQLRTAITVLTNRPSRTRTDRGIVISEIAVRNQDDVLVLSMKASIFILRRAA